MARSARLVLLVAQVHGLVQGPWSDPSLCPFERALRLLKNMTLTEKMMLLHGPPGGPGMCDDSPRCAYVGNVAPVERLGIPPLNLNDGPQGFRASDKLKGTSTAWPSGLSMAASWDEAAAEEWGRGMGKEFYDKGSNIQLGPGLNVARVPLNGRNFEYLSGEDPYLGYRMVQPVVKGIQSQKVLANAKHFILNNQETNREAVSSEIDERTRFEVYYPPFEGAIEAGVASMMCSYNKINNVWSCENPVTLGELKRMGFKGFMMSDWGATHSMSIGAGLDIEQPGQDWMNQDFLTSALKSGAIKEESINNSVERILGQLFAVGVMDEPLSAWDWSKLRDNVTTAASVASARRLSAKGTVLLRNEKLLPLEGGKIAVIGLAGENAIYHAGGSGSVEPSFVSTPLEGISAAAQLAGGSVHFDDGSCAARAAALAASCDAAIVFVGTLSGEGSDRGSLSLDVGYNWKNQNEVVEAIAAKAGAKTAVVVTAPGAILLPWSRKVAAVVTNFMPGQQAGNAIADVLFGRVNPSGKLPMTFPNRDNEMNFSQEQYPGVGPEAASGKPAYAFYTEQLLVGYRYYEAKNISFTTGFPFGHGLSYTTFEYSELNFQVLPQGVAVTFALVNAGEVPGAEVPQLYLVFPKDEPMQLKGFKKTSVLKPGEKTQVSMLLRPRDLSIWDSVHHRWQPVLGKFHVKVGSSSRDIRLTGSFDYNMEIHL